MIERCFRVTGRVQGVGFRYFVATLGRSLGVHGGVRNEADGSVIARAAAADAAAMASFRDGLERGPRAARVDSVADLADDAGPFDLGF